MTIIAALCQIVIALGIFNVWIIRSSRPTPYRPDGAANMAEEFRRYGFPDWVRVAVGGTKLILAALLLAGLWYTPVSVPAAALMASLMLAAIFSHIRVRNPLTKTMPALVMLILSSVVVVSHTV
jgi:uncharacterized membrane protein YphA (DoxX/SURF4 family)